MTADPLFLPDDADRAATSIRQALREAWTIARPFWRDPSERRARWLLAAVVALTLAGVWLAVRFSEWSNDFYNTLQDRDLPAFWRQLAVFGVIAVASIVAEVYRQYLQQLLVIRWRRWLTDDLQRRWLQPGTAWRLARRAGAVLDNPDQRIAEDARGFVDSTLELGLGLLNASVTLVSFVGILWGLSGTLLVPLGGGIPVPGYMVWVAVAYSLAGSALAHRLGRPLVRLNGRQQQVEADFRYALVQVRDHAEAIALARGEPREQARLAAAFDAIRANWMALIRVTKRLTWFSSGYAQLANVFPVLAAAPRYFSGALQLGGLMQTAQAFGQVQGALSWFIDAYPRLADWRATVRRLTTFDEATRDDAARRDTGPARTTDGTAGVLALSGLALHAPGGRALVDAASLRMRATESVLITGASGSGKSTLLRAIAGLWRDGTGRIALPAGARLMFVPQRPYLPAGSLREALAYPLAPDAFTDDVLSRALADVGLERLRPGLDRRVAWAAMLSPGEQQRLHFARVLLHRPDWVFLDESTSALDEATEAALYGLLRRALPGLTVVSVGHRGTLRAFHDTAWTLESVAAPDAGAPAMIRTAPIPPRAA